MRILLVEDEDRSIRQAEAAIVRAHPAAVITVKRFKDEAEQAIHENEYDLVVCDLRIPPNSNSVDADESHGLAVHALAREICPGTPLLFLTAYPVSSSTRRRLSLGEVDTLFGLPKHPMVDLVEKDLISDLEQAVKIIADALSALDAACLVRGADIDDIFQRAVRIYARSIGHSVADVESSSGLSGAIVGRVRLQSESSPPASAVIKVLPCAEAHEEYDRYNRFVANRLDPGRFAPALAPIHAGLCKKSALVSTLAGDGYASLFDLIRRSPDESGSVVAQLKEATSPWYAATTIDSMSLVDLRRSRVEDKYLSGIFDMDMLLADESVELNVAKAISHGDLHGENILVDQSGRPLLIDFGDVSIAPTVMDPVILELSLLFHDKGPARDPEFGRGINWSAWPDLAACYGSNPLASFAGACRAWALELANSGSVMAFGYAQSMRQFKYSDVPHDMAHAIARSCRGAL